MIFFITVTLLSCTGFFSFLKAIVMSDWWGFIDDNSPVISSHLNLNKCLWRQAWYDTADHSVWSVWADCDSSKPSQPSCSQQLDPKSDRQRALMGSTGLWECSLAAVSTGIAVFAGVNRWNLMQSLPLFLAVFIRQVLHSNSEITGDSISLISASRPLPFLSHS